MTRRHGILCCPSCRQWRPWFSFQERPKIDRHCIKCGKRIRVQAGSRSILQEQIAFAFPGQGETESRGGQGAPESHALDIDLQGSQRAQQV